MNKYISLTEASELVGKSKETLRRWDREGKLTAVREPMSNYRVYKKEQFDLFLDFLAVKNDEISNYVKPEHEYSFRENATIYTFPNDWKFEGFVSRQ